MENEKEIKKEGWNLKKEYAARRLVEGASIKDIASELGISARQISRWKIQDEFILRMNQILIEIRGEPIAVAIRHVRAKTRGKLNTKKDLLDWLKFISDETEKMDYSPIYYDIPPEQRAAYMTKATMKSLDKKNKAKNKKF
jgi:hypothetical protein